MLKRVLCKRAYIIFFLIPWLYLRADCSEIETSTRQTTVVRAACRITIHRDVSNYIFGQ